MTNYTFRIKYTCAFELTPNFTYSLKHLSIILYKKKKKDNKSSTI